MKEERNLTFLVLLMFNAYSANPNVVLAVTKHGGHLGFFEGIIAHSVWYIKT
jgi:predicted alpha/beta-fold hydrolase